MKQALNLLEIAVKRSGRTVVSGVSLAVSRGTWFGLVGANGSGKTTLLRAISGRLQITSGVCEFAGEDVTAARETRAQRIGFAPPVEHLPRSLSARELLEFAGDAFEVQQARNDTIWQALGLKEMLDIRMDRCSAGMRQRVSLALAFSYDAPLVILDEPFNWLDPVAAMDLRTVLAERVSEDLTLMTALHDMTTLCGFCDGGALMSEGQMRLKLSREDLHDGRSDPLKFERWMIEQLR